MPKTVEMTRAALEQAVEGRLRALSDRQGGNLNPRGGQGRGGPDVTENDRNTPGSTWRGIHNPSSRSNIRNRMTEDEARNTLRFFRAVYEGDTGDARRYAKMLNTRTGGGGQIEGDDTLGGGFVPEQFTNEVIIELPKYTPFVDSSLIRLFPMAGLTARFPKVKTKPSQPSVVQEEQKYGKTKVVFGHVRLIANKLGIIIPFTEDLLDDMAGVDMVQLAAELVAEQVANKRNYLVTNGSGADEPEGVRTSSEVGTSEWTDTDDASRADSLIQFFHALPSQYRRDAIWMMHDSVIERVRKLKDGNKRYLWTDGFGEAPATILGRPVFENPDIPTDLGDGNDETEILFGNFRRGYVLGQRKGLEVERNSSGEDWEADIVNFKFRERYDGRITDAAAFIRGTKVATS